jgi:ATP-binding cassette, subfamily G (WHITE), member 2
MTSLSFVKFIFDAGGLYFKTGITIAGFQSRVGCLFFLVRDTIHHDVLVLTYIQGALIAFSSLSALYNVVEVRPLFLRERSASYYTSVVMSLCLTDDVHHEFCFSPTAWLLSRIVFDMIPLRLIPTIVVSSMYVTFRCSFSCLSVLTWSSTYWMAGLAHDAAHFFKFLFILVLYSIAMTLFVRPLLFSSC